MDVCIARGYFGKRVGLLLQGFVFDGVGDGGARGEVRGSVSDGVPFLCCENRNELFSRCENTIASSRRL